MIYFYDIFEKAFNLFSDPDIDHKYFFDRVGFQQDMLDYLIIGKNKFTSPTAITDKLVIQDSPIGKLEIIDGDNTDTYVLVSEPHEHSAFTFKIGKDYVPGRYFYDETDHQHKVVFPRTVLFGETCSVAWYYAGAFSADFSLSLRADFPMAAILDKIVTILAYALVSAWADKEVNRVLDIRNVLTDTDFKLYSPANSADAKVKWRDQINKDMDTLVSELNWRILSEPKGGTRFGQ